MDGPITEKEIIIFFLGYFQPRWRCEKEKDKLDLVYFLHWAGLYEGSAELRTRHREWCWPRPPHRKGESEIWVSTLNQKL